MNVLERKALRHATELIREANQVVFELHNIRIRNAVMPEDEKIGEAASLAYQKTNEASEWLSAIESVQ